MKRFWVWFIPLIIILSLVVYLELLQINKNSAPLRIESKLDEMTYMARYDDRKIYTMYSINYYNNESLVTLFNSKKITVDEITNKMEIVDALNDGGSLIYYSNNKELSNEEFYIVTCNTLNGNKDIYIGDTKEIANNCNNKM